MMMIMTLLVKGCDREMAGMDRGKYTVTNMCQQSNEITLIY